jgi:hypothetical protein
VTGPAGDATGSTARPVADAVQWVAHELTFVSDRERKDPFWDVDVRVELTSPSGASSRVDAFWDGDRSWRARLRLPETGRWRWRLVCSDEGDSGLRGSGEVECVAYQGANPVYVHGPVKVADDGWSLAHADGTPFLWIGDTVWNGLIRSEADDWESYLETRRAQGFSAIQFFSTHWRALATDPTGQPSFHEEGRFAPNPRFYQRLDPKVEAIARHGLLAYAIVVLSLYDEEPGWVWPAEQLVRFARWLRARWGAYHMSWTLGGDGGFTGARAEERFWPIGRAAYSDPAEALVTMHPRGWTWSGPEFRNEPWVTFLSWQSGHSDDLTKVRWLPDGDVARDWATPPAKPIINLEPNYEDHPSYDSGLRFTAHEVRRAAYWSLLVAPTAGVTYGHFSLWAWAGKGETVGQGIRRQSEYVLEPWWTLLDTPGTRSMTVVRRYFETGNWWNLRPAQELILEQPGDQDVLRFLTAARTGDGSWTVIYAPLGGRIALPADATAGRSVRWFDPRTGSWRGARATDDGGTERAIFNAPDEDDWVLDLRS